MLWLLLLIGVLIAIYYYTSVREHMLPRGVYNGTFVNNTKGQIAYISDGYKRVFTDAARASCPPPISATLSMTQWNNIPTGVIFTKETCRAISTKAA